MKKILYLVVLIAVVSKGNAQIVRLGVKGGLNIATINDGNNSIDSRLGFHAGILSNIGLNNTVRLQPEVMFSTQGEKIQSGTDKWNYILIPILVQYKFNSGLFVHSGPQVGLLTSAKFENSGGEINNRVNFKSSDFSWVFGLGFVSKAGIGFDARYNYGLTDITVPTNNDVKNRVIQIGLFFQFPEINKKTKK